MTTVNIRYVAEWNSFRECSSYDKESEDYYIAQVLNKKPHPEPAFESVNGILYFGKRVGHQRMIKACQNAGFIPQISKNNPHTPSAARTHIRYMVCTSREKKIFTWLQQAG